MAAISNPQANTSYMIKGSHLCETIESRIGEINQYDSKRKKSSVWLDMATLISATQIGIVSSELSVKFSITTKNKPIARYFSL